MDRQTVYPGQLAQTTDLLKTGQNMMVGLAQLAAAVLGSTTIVNAFTVTPTTPAGLNVIVTPGEIYQLENIEQSTWSSLNTDSHNILKQGAILDPVTFGITPPGTVGYSQNFLIEVQYQDVDAGSTVLPYFNAANPSVPFSGPGNAGTAQNTVRKGVAALQVKAGTAATTGTQTTPTADAGWTGIYVVTVANGATSITSGNITKLNTAPWILSTLPDVPKNVQNGSWVYGTDTGTANNVVVNGLIPVPQAYTAGMGFRIKMAVAPTGASVANIMGLGNKPIVKGGNVALSGGEWAAGDIVSLNYDGTSFQISSSVSGVSSWPRLTANKDLYVDASTGSDTLYDGTTATVSGAHGPFLTIQKAFDTAYNYAPSQYTITIHIAAGTYTTGGKTPLYPGNTLSVVGAGLASSIINVTNDYGILVQGPNVLSVSGVRVNSTVASLGPACFASANGATLITSNCASNIPGSVHFNATQGATCRSGSHTFIGNCAAFWWATFNGQIILFNSTYTFSGAQTVSQASAWASGLGTIGTSSSNPCTYTGYANVTGPHYSVNSNGFINADGQGVNLFPGTTSGIVATGGQYV